MFFSLPAGYIDEHTSIFDSKLGTLNDTTVTIHLDPTAQPRFCKARTVPYALKGKIEKELDRLVQQGVIESICFSEWAAPIVPGLQPLMKKVRAIMEAPQPVNITQLKLFLEMLNYYGKFLPNL